MMQVPNPFGAQYAPLDLPVGSRILRMSETAPLQDPAAAIRAALSAPIGCASLAELARNRKAANPAATAVIVVSDFTRPVPYHGDGGLLWPLVDTLLAEGFRPAEILVLVANGTHRAMTDTELRAMLDARVFDLGIPVRNHDFRDIALLQDLGRTRRGTRVMIDRRYLDADLKIATGLIESHFMAGASGGRKAICPGLVGEETTYVFHGPELMAHPNSHDLLLDGNPVHEESLEVARMAGVDFLLNVTLSHDFQITGVFAGDLEAAHLAGFKALRRAVAIPVDEPAQVVVTHAGFVGRNHYQCAKCAVASLGALREGGWLVLLADTNDPKERIGALSYRVTLGLLKLIGPERFLQCIQSPDWTFLPEQWQVQQWGRLFRRIPQDHLLMYSPSFTPEDWRTLPGLPLDAPDGPDCMNHALQQAFDHIARAEGRLPAVTYLADGPYAIPVRV